MSPAELRVAARRLHAHGTSAREVARAGLLSGSYADWSGLAAMQARAALESWSGGVGRCADPVEVLATHLVLLAADVDTAQADVRSWTAQRDTWAAEIRHLDVRMGLADETTRPVLMRRRVELLGLLHRADEQVAAADARVERAADDVAERLEQLWSTASVEVAREAHALGGAVVQAGRAGAQLLVSGQVLRWSVDYARTADLAVRAALREHARDAAQRVLAGARRGSQVSRFAVVKTPLVVWLTAVPDVVTGGGYSGARGWTTRALAAASLPASVGVFAPHPVVIGGSLAVLGSYSLWTAGNVAYDHRHTLARVGGTAHAAGRRGAAHLLGVLRVGREEADRTATRGRDGVAQGLGRVGQEVREAMAQGRLPLGRPLRLGELPRVDLADIRVPRLSELVPWWTGAPAPPAVPIGPVELPPAPADQGLPPSGSVLELTPGVAVPRLPVHPGPLPWPPVPDVLRPGAP
jgi:hypothetical protein